MRRAEQLHEEILAQMDLSKEASDEELLELIHRILEEKSKEEIIPLGEKAILGRELFNAFRKLDILQELIEDEEITEIMINGTQPIFIERNGRIYETDKKFLSRGKLEDVVQQMVAGCNRVVNEATPIVDASLEDGSRVNVVLPPVALNGPIVTIRKFPKSRICRADHELSDDGTGNRRYHDNDHHCGIPDRAAGSDHTGSVRIYEKKRLDQRRRYETGTVGVSLSLLQSDSDRIMYQISYASDLIKYTGGF